MSQGDISEEDIPTIDDPLQSMIGLFMVIGIIITIYGFGYGSEEPGAFGIAIAGAILIGSAGIMSAIRELRMAIIEKL